MRRILAEKDYNTPEHYNEILLGKFLGSGLDLTQPLRANCLLEKFTGGKFLEVGCGVAPHCLMAKIKTDLEVWGLDFANRLIIELRRKYPEINYVVGDKMDLPFKDGYFDYVVAGEILEHSENPEEFLKELFRVIKVGGILATSTPLNDNGTCAPQEHIWGFDENDISVLLSKFGKAEVRTLEEDYHTYIIGYGIK